MNNAASFIDNTIVVIYLIIIFLTGIFNRSPKNNFKNFATFRKSPNISKFVLVATIFTSAVGGGTIFGIAEKSYIGDLSISYALLLTLPIELAVAYFLIPKLIVHQGIESTGDIMFKYYGNAGRILSGLAATIVSLGYLGAQVSVSGRIFQYILQIDYIKAVIISYSLIIIYTTVGGFRSIIITNILQFIAMIIAIPLISIIGIHKIGLTNFISCISIEKISPIVNDNLFQNTISAALSFTVIILFPNYIQRVIINNNPKETSLAVYYKSVIYGLFLVVITTNGLLAYQLFPEEIPSIALTKLIDYIMPIGLKGLVVIGLLAAVMSTADSDLNVISIAVAKDILSPIFKITDSQKLLIVARMTNILVGILTIWLALRFSNVIDLILFIAGFWAPVMVVPLIFGLYGITISRIIFLLNCSAGLFSFILFECFNNFLPLKGVFVGVIVHLILFLITLKFKKIKAEL